MTEAPAESARDRSFIVEHLTPGATLVRRVEVANDTSRDTQVLAYAAAADVAGSRFELLEGRAVNELTTWTRVEPPTLSLPPAGRGTLTVTVTVPETVSPGERYGVVWAELPAVPGANGVSLVNRVGVRMYVSVGPGAEPKTDFEVERLAAGRDAAGKPLVSAVVRNVGGRALDVSGEVTLRREGQSIGPVPLAGGLTVGVRSSGRAVAELPSAGVGTGPWKVALVVRSGSVERKLTGEVTFPRAPGESSESTPRDGSVSVLAAVVALFALGAVGVGLVLYRRGQTVTISASTPSD